MGGIYGDRNGAESQTAERVRRREQQRWRVRRQRLLAVIALLLVVVAVVGVIASGGGGSSKTAKSAAAPAGDKAQAKGEAGGRVRNATPQPGWKPYTGPLLALTKAGLIRPAF